MAAVMKRRRTKVIARMEAGHIIWMRRTRKFRIDCLDAAGVRHRPSFATKEEAIAAIKDIAWRAPEPPPITVEMKAIGVFAGMRCIGHLMGRGPMGVEGFDRSDRSLGIYADQNSAAAAVVRAAQ